MQCGPLVKKIVYINVSYINMRTLNNMNNFNNHTYKFILVITSCILALVAVTSCSSTLNSTESNQNPEQQTAIQIAAYDTSIQIIKDILDYAKTYLIGSIPLENIQKIDEPINYDDTNSLDSKEYWLPNSIYAIKSQAAVDAGGIVEYFPGFYVSHDYDQGSIFLTFDIGDVVHIDNHTVTIEGILYTSADVYYEDIRNEIGWDKICFQTCCNANGDLVFYYGSEPGANYYSESIAYEYYEYIEYEDEQNSITYDNSTKNNSELERLRQELEIAKQEVKEAQAAWEAVVNETPQNENRIDEVGNWYDEAREKMWAIENKIIELS